MSADVGVAANSAVWRRLYSQGKSDLRYPNDVLVRLAARLLDSSRNLRILDFGFGTGANLAHFASLGFETHGVEISEHALARAQQRLSAASLRSDLRLIEPGADLPFPDAHFDVTCAWQVLYYADRPTWFATVEKLDRVTKKGGLVILAIAAPGDISQIEAESLGDSVYRSRVRDQEGSILIIPELTEIPRLLPNRELEIGEFGFRFGAMSSRHWVITYRIPIT